MMSTGRIPGVSHFASYIRSKANSMKHGKWIQAPACRDKALRSALAFGLGLRPEDFGVMSGAVSAVRGCPHTTLWLQNLRDPALIGLHPYPTPQGAQTQPSLS